MKIALCLCCHVRTYKDTYSNLFNNVVQPLKDAGHSVDVFMHTWSTVDALNKTWWSAGKFEEVQKLAAVPVNKKSIVGVYAPKKLVVEEQTEIVPTPGYAAMDVAYVNKAYESANKAFRLAMDADKYDYIILTRPDVNYTSALDVKEIERQGLTTAAHGYFLKKGSLTDIWLMGQPEYLAQSLQMFWRMWSIHKPAVKHFEDSYAEHIAALKIPVHVSDLHWEVLRIDGSKFTPEHYTDYHPKAAPVTFADIVKGLRPDPAIAAQFAQAVKDKNTAKIRGWQHVGLLK